VELSGSAVVRFGVRFTLGGVRLVVRLE